VIREAQNKDDSISVVIQHLKAGAFPNKSDLRNMPEESKVLFNQWGSLLIRDDVFVIDTTIRMVLLDFFSWYFLEV